MTVCREASSPANAARSATVLPAPTSPVMTPGAVGEGQPLAGAALVADAARCAQPDPGPGPPGRVLRQGRGQPAADACRGGDDGGGVGRGRTAAAAAGAALSGHGGGDPDGLGAGAGRLPRQPLLGAAGVGRHDGAGRPPPRRGDVGHRRRGGGAGPTPSRTRRGRRDRPRHRACGGPGEGGAGRLYRPGAVPGQGAPASVGGGVGRGRPAARCPTGTGRARRGRSRPVRRGHRGRPRRHRGAVMTPAAGDGAAATTMSPTTMSPTTMSPTTMSEAERYQRLRSHLAFLRLPTATEALPEVLDQARAEGWGLLATLERLLAAEVEATEARRLASRLRFACLPAPWRIADFDFSAQPGVDESLIRELATLRFLDTAANLLFLGPGVIPGLA